jgi:hypothetical protein
MDFTIYEDDDVVPYLRSIEGEERRPGPPPGADEAAPLGRDDADPAPRDPEPDVAMETQ